MIFVALYLNLLFLFFPVYHDDVEAAYKKWAAERGLEGSTKLLYPNSKYSYISFTNEPKW